MADNLSQADRRKNMSAIRSVSKLEDKIAQSLWKRGVRFRRNVSSLFGKPDIAIKKYKMVIFIDSCYWHGCEIHGNMPKTNEDYWVQKLQRNKERDLVVTQYYKSNNWKILRIWEHEFKNGDFYNALDLIVEFIEQAKKNTYFNTKPRG